MTIRRKMQMTLVGFAVIPILVSSLIILLTNMKSTENLNLDRMDKLAHISALAFEEIVDLRKRELALLTTRQDFIMYTETLARYGVISPVGLDILKDFLRGYLDSVSTFNDIVVLDTEGIVHIDAMGMIDGFDLSEFDYFQRVMEAGDPEYVFVSKVHKSLIYPDDPSQNRLAMSRLLTSDDGNIQGVVVAYVNADSVAGFTKGFSFGKTGIAFVIDSDNFVLHHPDPSFFNTYTTALKLENLIPRYKAGFIPASGVFYEKMDGITRIYDYVVIGNSELVLILRQDYSEFTEGRTGSIILTAITFLVTAVIAAYWAMNFSKSFVAPILKLKDAFDAGRNEGTYVICNIDTNDEIGDMADGYNAMIRRLQAQFDEISKEKVKTEHVALHDGITGLYNRTAFEAVLRSALVPEVSIGSLGVFFLDLDGFKQVNDVMGHAFGDTLLYMLARRINNSSARFDLCARIGGDEFLLYKTGSRREVEECARILMDELRVPFEIEFHTLHMTCSMGVAMYPEDGDTAETLVKSADIAMYDSKDGGKNKYSFYDAEMQNRIDRHSNIMNVLRNCIKNGEIALAFQPEVDISTGAPAAYEALMRINSEKLGPTGPGEFIPIAESDNSMINKLGNWALSEACRFAKKLVSENGFDGVVAVNISISQLHRDNFVRDVLDTLAREGLDARHLQIELTESILMSDMDNNIKKLSELREKGVTIAMDDFGTHYSSFNYLIFLPLDVLKIDRSFFIEIETNKRMMEVNRAIVSLAHKLDLKVVAEGVETENQYKMIREIGCDIIQGYYFSRPMHEKDAIVWHNEHLLKCPSALPTPKSAFKQA